MHISEGLLSVPVLLGGAALTLGGLAKGVRDIRPDDIPTAALLAAVFFTASLIHINFGFISAHLILNGLVGLLLGWAAFPVVCAALLLQGLLFQFGGLTVLGVNTFNLALPAVLMGNLTRGLLAAAPGPRAAALGGLACGGGAVLLSGLLTAVSLSLSGDEFQTAARAVFLANLPVVVLEAAVTMFCLQFLRKVRPEMLRRPALPDGGFRP